MDKLISIRLRRTREGWTGDARTDGDWAISVVDARATPGDVIAELDALAASDLAEIDGMHVTSEARP